jgi:hypothetical protein
MTVRLRWIASSLSLLAMTSAPRERARFVASAPLHFEPDDNLERLKHRLPFPCLRLALRWFGGFFDLNNGARSRLGFWRRARDFERFDVCLV